MIEAADDKWGSVTQDGQWDGVLGMVHRGVSDAGHHAEWNECLVGMSAW